jgi:hypothetical protein
MEKLVEGDGADLNTLIWAPDPHNFKLDFKSTGAELIKSCKDAINSEGVQNLINDTLWKSMGPMLVRLYKGNPKLKEKCAEYMQLLAK